MSFSVGIIGLPNVGKSTLFKALTKHQVKIAPRPFTTIYPNQGKVVVPDKRLEKLSKIVQPEKVTYTTIEFVDVAGLVKDAWKGEGLGNQFLAQIRNCDIVLEIVRAFQDQSVEHIEGQVNPARDIEIIKTELLMKDLETLDKALTKLDKKQEKTLQKKIELIKKIKDQVGREVNVSEISLIPEEKIQIKELNLLSQKPLILILNIGSQNVELKPASFSFLRLNLKLEEEISELSKKELKEIKLKSDLPKVILQCYQALNLITFYTIAGGEETKAWAITKGSKTTEAAGLVHSDFEKKFIKAEIINWQELVKARSRKAAKENGLLKIVSRDYLVQDGDVIEFKI